jgi:SPP1 family phage portal protein
VDNLSSSPEFMVELYTASATFIYRSDNSLSSFRLVEDKPNYYSMVPITVFRLNEEEASIFEPIMGLQDAYNTLVSSEIDDWVAFCDSYLALYGFDADEETIKTMKENRVLVIPENGKAEYLEKNPSNQQIESMLNNIEQKIHKISACPDFSSEAFGTSSGIAMRMKLVGFENAAGNIEKAMTKALQRRIELICSILSLSGGEDVWRDIQIQFTRNLPVDASEVIAEINGLRGLVSDKTLLSQVPFVQDVDTELEEIQNQKKNNVALYNFSASEEN